MRIGHLALVVAGASALAGCGFLPPSQQQEFAVTGAPPVPQAGIFRNTNPAINDTQARQACAEGYEKLGEQTLPADPGTFEVWRVRCAPHETWDWDLF
jgi:hypothetical protein